jgi:hypothetical protein
MTWPLASVLPTPVGCWEYRGVAGIVPDRHLLLRRLSRSNVRLRHGR